MALAFRKLAMLEREFTLKEEAAKIQGETCYVSDPILREKVSRLMKQVKNI